MSFRATVRLLGAAIAAVAAAAPAAGYIHFPPPTLRELCQRSTNVRVLAVRKHDPGKGVIVYEVVETLKGETPKGMSCRHAVGKDTAGAEPIRDWVADGRRAV